VLADTSYENGVLTICATGDSDLLYVAYFAPYSMERHHDLVAALAELPQVSHRALGVSLDGQPIDCLTIGEGPLTVWLYARQHPGESMAEWWMEGALEKLVDPDDAVARALRARCTFHCVPNMNPDGSARGALAHQCGRREPQPGMARPSAERSPEVLCVRNAMDEAKPVFAMDIHGDEAIAANFLAGFEGIPSLTPRQEELYHLFANTLERICPDFQTQEGYELSRPGEANLSMSTTQLAERYGCVSMTLEMPFKDHAPLADPVHGWSAERSKLLAHCLPRRAAPDPARTGGGSDADPCSPSPRAEPVEPRESLHRLVGRRHHRGRRGGGAGGGATARSPRASTSTSGVSPPSRSARSAPPTWRSTRWTAPGCR
jgi:murein tripeptide amidase MpaA